MKFPSAFEARVKDDPFLGEELLNALNTEAPVSVRLNPLKLSDKEAATHLKIKAPVEWCRHAFYLQERPSFTLDPLFHAGCYYPQEAGSMILDSVLKQLQLPEAPFVLDLCAAPGGKSTLIASHLNQHGVLVSNEVIQSRARILRENLTKWGTSNVLVTNNDPKDFQRVPSFFDLIVIDAPCSGEGMFRKDPDSRNEWSEDNVQLCSARQKRIIADVWDALKPGGYAVYSTCTFNTQENEENVEFMIREMGAELIEIPLNEPILRGRNGIGNYCLPGKTDTEGFYLAVLQKPDGTERKVRFEQRRDLQRISNSKELDLFREYAAIDGYELFKWNDLVLAWEGIYSQAMLHLMSQLRIVKAGTIIGELNRKGLLPHEELALNPVLCHFENRLDLSREDALRYLHGDTFSVESTQGIKLVTHQEIPLGWIKHLGNRFNNLYPKEWRIRMNIS